MAHDLHKPANAAALINVTLCGEARLWMNDKCKVFSNINALNNAFLRFTPGHSAYANDKLFDELSYKSGETADKFLS